MIGFTKTKTAVISGAGNLQWAAIPADKSWLLKSAWVYTTGAGNTGYWMIVSPDGNLSSPAPGALAIGTNYEFGDVFPALAAGDPLELSTLIYIRFVVETYSAGSIYLNGVILERPKNWDVQYLEWQVLQQQVAPPGFASLQAELGYRARKDLV